MSHITTEDPATLRLPFKEKLSYGIGDLASNILLDIGTLYLLKFYTDVFWGCGTYGGIIFDLEILYRLYRYGNQASCWIPDARSVQKVNSVLFILYASFPVTLLAIANFIGTPFDVAIKTVMATILFMLYGLFFSMMNCSYGAMVPAITKNPNERASLAAWRQGGATLGLLLCTVGFVLGYESYRG
ncbi:MFS transporter [Escherichia coli]|uniref:MFS transporter n=1 Tax=Escherichia coli TaxID=562 RepID=UPI001CDC29AC|nr:MFS transporter [Escherichia coli]